MLLPVAYVTEWTFIGLQNAWLLLFGIISSELSYISEYFQIPTFLVDEHCLKCHLSQYHEVLPLL